MYVYYLLGLGGPVGAPADEDDPAPAAEQPAAELPRPARDPGAGCPRRRPPRCCRWRDAGLRA